jgi:hypothetical protein
MNYVELTYEIVFGRFHNKNLQMCNQTRKYNENRVFRNCIMDNKNSETSLLDFPENIKIEKSVFQKMMFLINALDQGWSIRKSNDFYIFTKKHENRREIFKEDYLDNFLITNSSINRLLCRQT